MLISKEIYCALDEACWYDLFEANVLLPYLENITPSSEVYDDRYKHICSAIDNIYSPKHVLRVLSYLVEILPINTVVPSSLISNYLNIRSLPGKGLSKILSTMKGLDLNKVYAICYSLNHYNKLPKSILTAIRSKISREDIHTFINNHSALVQISALFSDNEFVRWVKSAVLESNVWDCGIREKMRVRPNVIQLEYFPKWYVWEDEECEILFDNMKYNLSLIESLKQQSEEARILLGSLVDVVYSMLFFFSKNTCNGEHLELEQRLKNELLRLRGFDNGLEGFVSDDPDKYEASHVSLVAGLTLKSVAGNYTDISLEVDRALFEQKVCLNRVLSNIAFYCANYKDMVTLFSDRLLLILDRYKKVDYRALNLNKSWAFSSLYRIAFFVSKLHPDNEKVKYWMEDQSVQRFNLVKFWTEHLHSDHV